MSETEKSETELQLERDKARQEGRLKFARFIFGVLLVIGAGYGWKMMQIDGFLMFIVGAAGIGIAAEALGIKDWSGW